MLTAPRSKRIALYARCSTADQNPEVQQHRLREYAQARGWEAVEFTDAAVSGRVDRRPELDRMMAAARRRDVDAVAVVKLDRLARSVRHLIQLGAELEALGADLIVIDQGVDTSTPAGRLLFTMLAAVAEFEGDLIRERTLAGIAAARRRGKQLGRPRACDRRDKERVVRLRRAGQSLRQIAATLGVGKATVGRVLKEAEACR